MTAITAKDPELHGKAALLGGVLFLVVTTLLAAQETSLEQLPGLRERALIMRVVSRVVERNQQVVWDSENTNVTMPGRPVGVNLVGTDLVVVVQFTPFLGPDGNHTLVAQSQIWVNVPGEGMSFQTTMQTIPWGFGELVYFFPLGPTRSDDEAHIEIQLLLEPYTRPRDDETRPRQPQSDGTPNPNRVGPRANPR